MSYKIYEYKNCGTCKKALKFLDQKKIPYKKIAIRETPPTKTELKKMLSFVEGDIKKLFNTSGVDYRELKIKDKLPKLSDSKAIDLLASNGNLIKRPFMISSNKGWVGFKEDIWKKEL
ncbi:ArsC family transcriptional regulator [bacterium K02(2017)]|nr:ArsC family transcriptional regulator [bacterium K02(2017)]